MEGIDRLCKTIITPFGKFNYFYLGGLHKNSFNEIHLDNI